MIHPKSFIFLYDAVEIGSNRPHLSAFIAQKLPSFVSFRLGVCSPVLLSQSLTEMLQTNRYTQT